MLFLFARDSVENTDSSFFKVKVTGAIRMPTVKSLMFMLLFPILLVAKPAVEEAGEGDIPRFSIPADGLYRGGQPTARGFQFWKDKGIRPIINLRAEDNFEAKTVEKIKNELHPNICR
jgi:hypothetical protein